MIRRRHGRQKVTFYPTRMDGPSTTSRGLPPGRWGWLKDRLTKWSVEVVRYNDYPCFYELLISRKPPFEDQEDYRAFLWLGFFGWFFTEPTEDMCPVVDAPLLEEGRQPPYVAWRPRVEEFRDLAEEAGE